MSTEVQARSREALSTASACDQLPLQLQFRLTSKHASRNSFLICLSYFKTPLRLLLLPPPPPPIASPNAAASRVTLFHPPSSESGAPTTELPAAASANSHELFSNLHTAHAARISFCGATTGSSIPVQVCTYMHSQLFYSLHLPPHTNSPTGSQNTSTLFSFFTFLPLRGEKHGCSKLPHHHQPTSLIPPPKEIYLPF